MWRHHHPSLALPINSRKLPLTTPEWTRLLTGVEIVSTKLCFENFNLLWYYEQSWWICFECAVQVEQFGERFGTLFKKKFTGPFSCLISLNFWQAMQLRSEKNIAMNSNGTIWCLHACQNSCDTLHRVVYIRPPIPLYNVESSIFIYSLPVDPNIAWWESGGYMH